MLKQYSAIRKHANVVSNFNELTEELERILNEWSERWPDTDRRVFFRGEEKEFDSLDPSLLRKPFLGKDLEEIESNITNDFLTRGRPFLGEIDDSWELMFLMQHHFVPTRLLDWTESLACAAYFSVKDVNKNEDGIIWALATKYLVEKDNHYGNIVPIQNVQNLYGLRDRPKRLTVWEDLTKVVPVMPNYISPRMVAQHSRFTIHYFEPNLIEKLAISDREKHGEGCFLHQIKINKSQKKLLKDQVNLLAGINEYSIFPDLDGLGRLIKNHNW